MIQSQFPGTGSDPIYKVEKIHIRGKDHACVSVYFVCDDGQPGGRIIGDFGMWKNGLKYARRIAKELNRIES